MLNKVKILFGYYFVISWTGGTDNLAGGPGLSPTVNVDKVIKDLGLTLNGKSLNLKKSELQKILESHLFGDTLEERATVWPLMAQLNEMIAKANNEKIERNSAKLIEDVDGLIEDDIILDKEDIQDIIKAFKQYPDLMKIGPSSSGTPFRLSSVEQSKTWRTLIKDKSKRWKMPIKYRVKKGISSMFKGFLVCVQRCGYDE